MAVRRLLSDRVTLVARSFDPMVTDDAGEPVETRTVIAADVPAVCGYRVVRAGMLRVDSREMAVTVAVFVLNPTVGSLPDRAGWVRYQGRDHRVRQVTYPVGRDGRVDHVRVECDVPEGWAAPTDPSVLVGGS